MLKLAAFVNSQRSEKHWWLHTTNDVTKRFLHKIFVAPALGIHLVYTEIGACGIRLVCLLLKLTGLDRFVRASYGMQHQVNRQVEEAIVAYRCEESARLAQGGASLACPRRPSQGCSPRAPRRALFSPPATPVQRQPMSPGTMSRFRMSVTKHLMELHPMIVSSSQPHADHLRSMEAET